MKKIVIFQYRLLHCRLGLFKQLREACASREVDLHLVHGQAQLSHLWSPRRVAYWGHGVNFQSDAPADLREKWKQMTLKRVTGDLPGLGRAGDFGDFRYYHCAGDVWTRWAWYKAWPMRC